MKKSQDIRYIERPDTKDFPDDDVAELVNILNNVNSTNSGVRHRIALALGNTPDDSRAIDEIDPAHWPIRQMREFRDQGKTIIAKDGEKTVGMVGFEELPAAPNGQRVFEIRRTTVLPDYRGGGIGRILRESMIKRLQEIDADAILLSRIHKDNIVNQNLAASTRFTKISDEDMKRLGAPDDWIQGNTRNGYEFYVFNPRDNASQKK
jgi:ribosomal protein S18 acetylase RimI-like enzyme